MRDIFGDGRLSLWLRGIFGTASVMAVFYGVQTIGIGETSFLNASHAFWVALLGPFVLKQKGSFWSWLAVGLGLCGLYLVFDPQIFSLSTTSEPSSAVYLGRTFALLSGLFGALAYLMVSKSGASNHPISIVFYFTFVASIIHVIWFFWESPVWPQRTNTYGLLIGAGLAATLAQLAMTRSYQLAPAAIVAATSFFGPVVNLTLGIFWFDNLPSVTQLIGAGIVTVAGVLLPIMIARSNKKLMTDTIATSA